MSYNSLLDEIEQELNTIRWPKRAVRRNVSYMPCDSITFGEVMRPYYGRVPSSCNAKFPKLFELLQKLSKMLNFSHSSYAVNKNVECLPHTDPNNLGDSLILALGNFTGGNLFVEGQKFNILRVPLK